MSMYDIRRDYQGDPFLEDRADPDPFRQFAVWFEEVRALEPDPTAMALATSTRDGRPSVRTLLMKAFSERGFVFFTSYDSRKGRELAVNNRASMLFFWRSRERQVRIEGTVEKISGGESDEYFQLRPLESRLAVWAARQGEAIPSRAVLEERYEEMRRRFSDGRVPRPDWWGGYRLVPDGFEFWQGRLSRLHDRLVYRQQTDGTWRRERLAP
jgi:pyridoxamine 5'-phosphate oxidase